MAASLVACNVVCSSRRNPACSNSRRLKLSADGGSRGIQAAALRLRPLQQPRHTVVRPSICAAFDCSAATVLAVEDLR